MVLVCCLDLVLLGLLCCWFGLLVVYWCCWGLGVISGFRLLLGLIWASLVIDFVMILWFIVVNSVGRIGSLLLFDYCCVGLLLIVLMLC